MTISDMKDIPFDEFEQVYKIAMIITDVRLEFISKYGARVNLCGHSIASEKIVWRIRNKLNIDAITVEGWCLYDDCCKYKYAPHTWVEIPSLNLYIDVTADQFNYGLYPENKFPDIVIRKYRPSNITTNNPENYTCPIYFTKRGV